MSFSYRSIALSPGEGKTIPVLGDSYTYKAVGGDTQGNYSLLEIHVKGDGPPPHIHKTEEEAFYILEGELTLQVGDQTIKGTAGSFVLVPRGVVHAFTRAGTPSAKVLAIISPAGFEQFFEEISGPPDIDKVLSVAEKYNLEIVGPK